MNINKSVVDGHIVETEGRVGGITEEDYLCMIEGRSDFYTAAPVFIFNGLFLPEIESFKDPDGNVILRDILGSLEQGIGSIEQEIGSIVDDAYPNEDVIKFLERMGINDALNQISSPNRGIPIVLSSRAFREKAKQMIAQKVREGITEVLLQNQEVMRQEGEWFESTKIRTARLLIRLNNSGINIIAKAYSATLKDLAEQHQNNETLRERLKGAKGINLDYEEYYGRVIAIDQFLTLQLTRLIRSRTLAIQQMQEVLGDEGMDLLAQIAKLAKFEIYLKGQVWTDIDKFVGDVSKLGDGIPESLSELANADEINKHLGDILCNNGNMNGAGAWFKLSRFHRICTREFFENLFDDASIGNIFEQIEIIQARIEEFNYWADNLNIQSLTVRGADMVKNIQELRQHLLSLGLEDREKRLSMEAIMKAKPFFPRSVGDDGEFITEEQ